MPRPERYEICVSNVTGEQCLDLIREVQKFSLNHQWHIVGKIDERGTQNIVCELGSGVSLTAARIDLENIAKGKGMATMPSILPLQL